MRSTPYESAAAPTSHSAADLPNLMLFAAPILTCQIKLISNAALLPYLVHQLGSAHEWSASGVWNRPKLIKLKLLQSHYRSLQQTYITTRKQLAQDVWFCSPHIVVTASKANGYPSYSGYHIHILILFFHSHMQNIFIQL